MRRALVIGIDDYPGSDKLQGCVNDANIIGDLLQVHGGGRANFAVTRLLSPDTPGTRRAVREAIATLFSRPGDVSLLFFSGHGVLGRNGSYHLGTIDSRQFDEGVSMDEVLQLANRSPATNKVLILDCCHAGAAANTDHGGGSHATLSPGLTVLTSSLAHESAVATANGSVFTALLAEGLSRNAADLLGRVTPGSLYAYVDQVMGAMDQRPMFKAHVSGLCTLREIPPKVPPEKVARITTYFKAPEDEYPLSPQCEFTQPDHDKEKVVVFQALQQLVSMNIVEPVGEQFMYFAAMNSKSCRLTSTGRLYWRLAKEGKLGQEVPPAP